MGFLSWIKGFGVQTFKLNADDIVVFVIGPSGSGKSTFVQEATRSGLVTVGTNLSPRTGEVQAIRCELAEEAKRALRCTTQNYIVFVDTPSFHTGQNGGAEGKMMKWLSKSKCASTLIGIIYVHRIETEPRLESIQQHLDTFASTFPQESGCLPRRLHAILSHLDGIISDGSIRSRRESFLRQLDALRPGLWGRHQWAASAHPDVFRMNGSETAWQAVVALFSS